MPSMIWWNFCWLPLQITFLVKISVCWLISLSEPVPVPTCQETSWMSTSLIAKQNQSGWCCRHPWCCSSVSFLGMISAMSWENLFMPYADNKDANQPAHPRSLSSVFVICCLDSIMPLVSIQNFKTLASFCGCAGCLSQTPKTGFLVT